MKLLNPNELPNINDQILDLRKNAKEEMLYSRQCRKERLANRIAALE